MRVAMVAPRYFPDRGGVELHVKAIAERLVEAGVEVEVFTTDPTRRLPPVELVGGVTVRRFPAWAPNHAYYVSPWHLVGLAQHARRFDLIHAHSYQALTCLSAALVTGSRRPFLFTPHYHGGRGESWTRNLVHLPWRLPGGWLFRRAQRVICVSAAERVSLQERFPRSNVVVIPNGVRLDSLRAAVPWIEERTCSRVVLCVGRLERYKNVERLIACASHLPEDWRVVIVGSGPYEAALRQQIARRGLSGRVEIKGGVSDEALFRWYQTCDVYVNLSSLEAFGMTVLEALAAGKPVVANDIPAFRETSRLSPLVHLVDLHRLDDSGLACALRSAAATRADPPDLDAYSWDEVAGRTLAVYHEVLGDGCRR